MTETKNYCYKCQQEIMFRQDPNTKKHIRINLDGSKHECFVPFKKSDQPIERKQETAKDDKTDILKNPDFQTANEFEKIQQDKQWIINQHAFQRTALQAIDIAWKANKKLKEEKRDLHSLLNLMFVTASDIEKRTKP